MSADNDPIARTTNEGHEADKRTDGLRVQPLPPIPGLVDRGDRAEPPAAGAPESEVEPRELSSLEMRALQFVAAGLPNTRVGDCVERSSKWVQLLRKRREAVEYLDELNAEFIEEAHGRLATGMLESLTIARLELGNDNPAIRMRAVDFFGKRFDQTYLATRQAAELVQLRQELAEVRALVAQLEADKEEDL